MRMPAKRGSRSVDYLLSVLSPLEVARSTRRFFEGLDAQERAALIARSSARLDDEERAYLTISPDFVTFLEQNRRALRTLDADALRAILLPVIVEEPGDELVAQLRSALPQPSPSLAIVRLTQPWRDRAQDAVRAGSAVATALAIVASGVAAAALLTILVRSMPSHPAVASVALAQRHARPATPPPRITAHHPRQAPIARSAPRGLKPTPAPTPRATPRPTPPPATPRPSPPKARASTAHHPPVHHRPRPRPIRDHRVPAVRATVLAAASIPSNEPRLVARARLIVMSYLDSLMRGDASAALGNLGLSASAGSSNLTEAPILAGATEFRIVRASLASAGNANVQVVIDSPQGRYLGNYVVSADGPAVWITQHQVVPSTSGEANRKR